MHTQCPQCDHVFSVTADNLRFAMGMVRCTNCTTVFNALATLREKADIEHENVTDVGAQLPFVQLGDAAVLHAVAGRALFQKLRYATLAKGFPASALSARAEPSAQPLLAPVIPDEVPDLGERSGVESHRVSRLFSLVPPDLLLAFRNLCRHRKRTALALGAIGFGVIALVLAGGFMEWVLWAMRESAIQGRLGHIQVTQRGFLTDGVSEPFAYLLPEGSAVEKALANAPHVSVLSPRLVFSGLASHGEMTLSYLADGVDPVKEAKIGVDFRIASGEPLAADDPNGIIVGMGLADLLNVKPGDTVTLLANTSSGGLNGIDTHVRGIFYTSNKLWNDSALRVPIALGRQLLRVEGAHIWVLLLDDTAQTAQIQARLSAVLKQTKGATKLELTPWTQLADFYNKTVGLFSSQMNVVRFIIGLIIVLSISNVLVMGVLQRTAEIGTLMAVGLRRNKILRLFISEGALLGLVGGGSGVTLGYALAELISYVGIPMPPAPGMDKGFTGEIMVTWPLAISTFVIAFGTTLLAAVYPAWKASRLEIVNALRHSK